MPRNETISHDAQALALNALVWILGDDARANRLLALTGLESDDMRARIGDPALLIAVLDFLAQHEPDLIACAEELGVKPMDMISARERMNA